MPGTDTHKHSKMVRKKVHHKRSLKVRLKNKLSFSLGKEKIIYIIIGIILAALVAKALIWYIQKTEEDASLKMNQYAAAFSSDNIKSIKTFFNRPLRSTRADKGWTVLVYRLPT